MSLMEPVVATAEDRWRRAALEADSFRGAFIRDHARGDLLISEALLALHAAGKGKLVALEHLGDPRLAELRRAVLARKTECGHMTHVTAVLDGFQQFESARAFICHGAATLVLDESGQWALGYKLLCFKTNVAERKTWFLTQADAATLLGDIAAAVARLPPALGHVRKLARG